MIAIVVPCYNEAKRLDVEAFLSFHLPAVAVRFFFVDDGSQDDTAHLLNAMAARAPATVRVVTLPRNAGKAEAVRRGMQAALEEAPAFVGYWDADLATPLCELPRFLEVMKAKPNVSFVIGARVRLLGRRVERRMIRHYLGRVFATAASKVLDLPVYDTQCGAKLLRMDVQTARLFDVPFRSRWVFDVELIARFIRCTSHSASAIYEVPLSLWRDVAGSKLGIVDGLRAAEELFDLWRGLPPADPSQAKR